MRKHYFPAIVIGIVLVFTTGCVGYVAPYPEYSAPIAAPYYSAPPPYRGYSYQIYPVVPLPMPMFRFGGPGWGHGWHGHYRHHR